MTSPKSDIPGPKAWPIFGNILLVSQFNRATDRIKFIDKLTAKYKHDNESLHKLIKTIDEIFSGPGPLTATGIFPILNFLTKDSVRVRVEGFATLKKYIDEHISEHRDSFDPENIRDFIDMYLEAEKDEIERTSSLNPGGLFSTIADLFAAGTDTTATTLDWSLLYMIQYPDVQKRCQEEITKFIGAGRMVRISDRRRLPYTEATIMEIQRLSNIALFAVPHVSVCDTTINGYKIPKNTIIIPSLVSVHLDETIWTDPTEFNPGRFLNQNNEIINKEYLMPFSLGPRSCPGESLARTELFLIFSNLLQRFEFSKVDSSDILSFEGITGITQAPSPYRLKADLR
ncbi:CYP2U1 [Mytilus edulis]|uniref:CYP2U1 n=1 Tax=Mytilus edulis TaxID=6550 RepID=A0A8S3T5X1_MYTED|nr:CYP2U1 [Mytilus edulis]